VSERVVRRSAARVSARIVLVTAAHISARCDRREWHTLRASFESSGTESSRPYHHSEFSLSSTRIVSPSKKLSSLSLCPWNGYTAAFVRARFVPRSRVSRTHTNTYGGVEHLARYPFQVLRRTYGLERRSERAGFEERDVRWRRVASLAIALDEPPRATTLHARTRS